MTVRSMLWLGGLLVIAGCAQPVVAPNADRYLCELAARPRDLEPLSVRTDASEPPTSREEASRGSGTGQAVALATDQTPDRPAPRPPSRLEIPSDLPGGNTPRIDLPADEAERRKALEKLYPPLPQLPPEPAALPGPGGKPYTLADLQALAAANNPTLRQAALDVENAKALAVQAGAYPNPSVFYQADTVGTAGGPGYQGGGFHQTISTFGKLKLKQAAATMDLLNAQLSLRAAQNTVATQVRTNYFAVLVSRESHRVSHALVRFTDEVYRVQLDLVQKGGFAAAYEPAALLVSANTARLALANARSSYVQTWRQLAASTGVRDLPLSQLAGRVDMPVPRYHYEQALAHILTRHTDVLTVRNSIQRARYNLLLARVTPLGDVDLNVLVQKDFTGPPFDIVHSVQVSVPVPIWDQNKGNIAANEAQLQRAAEDPHRVEVDLTNRLAQAFQNYEYNRQAIELYRSRILPDAVRFYRGVYERRGIDPGVTFGDLVNAQQTLSTNVAAYVTLLGSLWTSVVNVADLLQTDDLFQLAENQEVEPVPDLGPLPCCHPCGQVGSCNAATAVPCRPPVEVAPAEGPRAPHGKHRGMRRPIEAVAAEDLPVLEPPPPIMPPAKP